MRVIRTVFSVAAIFCYILILLILIIAAPMVRGYRPVVVLTGSMEPDYPVGSVIYYKNVPFNNIRVGDVISYSLRDDFGTVVTHRVQAIDSAGRTFTTKGDANAAPDVSPMPYANVRGKVVGYKIPYIGYFIKIAQNYAVIGTIIFILLMKMLLDYLVSGKTVTV